MSREPTLIPLEKVNLEAGTQGRDKIDESVVHEYAGQINAGDPFPPLIVFFDAGDYVLADGFHRYHAYVRSGATAAQCDIRKGLVWDAIQYAAGANATHGLRRTNADKKKCVSMILSQPESKTLTDRKIAEICAVSHTLVSEVRRPERAQSKRQSRSRNAGIVAAAATPSPTVGAQNRQVDTNGRASVIIAEHEPDDTDFIQAEATKRRANGKAVVGKQKLKAAMSALAALARFADDAKLGGEMRPHLLALQSLIEGLTK
jgi:hypothetical protein